MIIVSVIFGICWIIGFFIYVLSYYDIYMFGDVFYVILDILFMFNLVVNFFVYFLLNECFKRKIKIMFCSKCIFRVYILSESVSIELFNNLFCINNIVVGYID